jgi:Methyltransferase domain
MCQQRRINSRGASRRERARHAFEGRLYRVMIGLPHDPPWKLLVAALTERGYLSRMIRRRLRLPTPLDTADRRVLEKTIIPGYLADPAVKRVLFVGCDSYTAHYEQRYFSQREYWTLEPNPNLRRYGAKRRHVIGRLEELATHFAERSFDLIICNGVYGWGLNTAEQCEAAFAQCHICLSSGGHLLIGWDDVPTKRRSVRLADVASLARFEKFRFPALGTWQYVTDTPYRHTYEFYRRP